MDLNILRNWIHLLDNSIFSCNSLSDKFFVNGNISESCEPCQRIWKVQNHGESSTVLVVQDLLTSIHLRV